MHPNPCSPAFTTRSLENFEVVTLTEAASRQTLGGRGPIPEAFRTPGPAPIGAVSFYG